MSQTFQALHGIMHLSFERFFNREAVVLIFQVYVQEAARKVVHYRWRVLGVILPRAIVVVDHQILLHLRVQVRHLHFRRSCRLYLNRSLLCQQLVQVRLGYIQQLVLQQLVLWDPFFLNLHFLLLL